MKAECIAAVRSAAGGRTISDTKLGAIESSLDAQMRELARRDPERWRGLSRDQRVAEATAQAMGEIKRQAALKVTRAALQVLRASEAETRISGHMTQGKMTRSQGLVRDLETTGIYADAVRNEAIAGLGDMVDAAAAKDGTGVLRRAGMFLFDLDNPAMTRDVVREVFGMADGHTGNAVAKAGAKAWLSTIESLRLRFNAAGGDIGRLGYGYLSQAHDAVKVQAAGADDWAAKVLPLLDRRQYLRADGSLMADAEVTDMLRAAHETIATGGANKTEPGQFRGSGARANHGNDHRVLHFKDGDAWMDYMRGFGEGSLYDAMMGHVGAMARDVALLERYGPNPEQWWRVQDDTAARADGRGTMASKSAMNQPGAYWSILTGKTGTAENQRVAAVGQNLRNLQTAAKLGGAVVSSFTDVATVGATLHFNRLPYFGYLRNIGRQALSGEHRKFLQAHGVIGESLTGTLNRWTGDNLTHSLSGRVAGSVMKLSLMNAWSDGLRGAFAATMMQGFARKSGKAWGQLDEWDRHLLERKGITEAEWKVIAAAAPTDRVGTKYLTAAAIRETGAENAAQVASKWLAFVHDEAQFAVINPDLATRAIVTGGGMQAGTLGGEAMRCAAQFKAFPVAMMTRHWRRIFETPQGMEGAPMGFTGHGGATTNRVAVFAALQVSAMMLGAAVLQSKALLQGKDPYAMLDDDGDPEGRFWLRALAQGGGMGYLGDVLLSDPTEYRGNGFERAAGVLGPVAGTVAGLGDLTVGNAWEFAKSQKAGASAKLEDTHAAAEAMRWANSNLPYANLWQTRAAWEHWFIHNAQEAVNPGYLSRMQRRAQKDWGQGYWWEPGEAVPNRAPDMGQAIGQ